MTNPRNNEAHKVIDKLDRSLHKRQNKFAEAPENIKNIWKGEKKKQKQQGKPKE